MTIIDFAKTMPENTGRRAVFIDRDGVINEEHGYVHLVEDFVLLPGVIEGLRTLQAAGFLLVVVTNQAGIARGLYSPAQYAELTRHMRVVLGQAGVTIDAVYHCPHHPTKGVGEYRCECSCRKPQPGMLLQAASDLGLNLRTSVLIGDKLSDIEAGRAAHLKSCVLVMSGHANSEHDREVADICVAGLREAADWLTVQA